MIKGTVALPVWKSKFIAWLCMESLCRQKKPKDGWELIVMEEKHDEQLTETFFRSYERKLRKVGCERILYYDPSVKWPLSQKWIFISVVASQTSEYFVLCATDNYYSRFMLRDAEKDIKNADWCVKVKGYFYDFNYDKVLRYNFPSSVGLQMVAKTELVRRFPLEEVNKGVDMWFAKNMGSNMLINDDHWDTILCTNGMNSISTERAEFFEDPIPPYYETDKELKDIVPDDIVKKLKMITTWRKSQ